MCIAIYFPYLVIYIGRRIKKKDENGASAMNHHGPEHLADAGEQLALQIRAKIEHLGDGKVMNHEHSSHAATERKAKARERESEMRRQKAKVFWVE